MNPALLTAFVVVVLVSAAAGSAGAHESALPRSTPEAQGVSSSAMLAFVEAADRQIEGLHSLMILRHGHVITEGWWAPFEPKSNHELYSLSKSFASTAVGMAVAEGRLSVDDPVLQFFPEEAPAEPSANLKAMRVRDLLGMVAGHQDETSSAADKISSKAFLAHPVPHKPGTHFKYNTPATFMLSAIVQKQTGLTLLDYLRPRLFEPLGIENPVWNTNWQGISLGGYGLRARTEDIAKFGLLYLRKGDWGGKQLLPESWVEAATGRQVSNGSNPKSDWEQGYGYQFWRCRHGAYRGDGAFGQYCIVLPEQGVVVAITSGLKDMQAVLDLVWNQLLPAVHPRRLSPDHANRKKLSEKLGSLTLSFQEGSRTSPVAAKVSGRQFIFPSNSEKLESVSLSIHEGGGGATLISRSNGVESRILCGYREWKKGRAPFGSYSDEPVAACGAWVADDTYALKVCAFETPYTATLRFRFAGDQVFRDSETNVGFGATKRAQLVGQAN